VVDVPDVGTKVMDIKYNGSYTGSAVRWDLGFLYDFNPDTTMGVQFENVLGAALSMSGSGLATYARTKLDTNLSSPSIDPKGSVIWTPFQANYSTMEGTAGWNLPSTMQIELPKIFKMGVTFKKPVLFTADYQLDLHKVNIANSDTGKVGTISGVSQIKLGLETQIAVLPVWFRMGLGLMLKPSVSGDNTQLADSINSTWSGGIVPSSLDLGLSTYAWDTDLGVAFRASGVPVLRSLAGQISDLTELVRYEIYGIRGPFKMSWITAGESFLTGFKMTSTTGQGENTMNIAWTNTLSFGYSF
jgi:hypothetical protein